MNDEIEKFKKGIFSLNTRRFGRIAELMIKELYKFEDSTNLAYDLVKGDGTKIEVKFSTVLKKCGDIITINNAISEIENSTIENRMLSFEQAKSNDFDCNIQQVKPAEFSELYYGCFFEDKIMICKINSIDIKEGTPIVYSDHQHRGNHGEGQFHINNGTLNTHLQEYLVQWLTYDELFQLLSN